MLFFLLEIGLKIPVDTFRRSLRNTDKESFVVQISHEELLHFERKTVNADHRNERERERENKIYNQLSIDQSDTPMVNWQEMSSLFVGAA